MLAGLNALSGSENRFMFAEFVPLFNSTASGRKKMCDNNQYGKCFEVFMK